MELQIENLPENGRAFSFTDTRYLSFALTGLEPGSAFELQGSL
jgi:hypothetical protein